MIVCHLLKFEPFLVISSCIHLTTSLDMLKNRIKSYHITMDIFGHDCRIISNRVVIFEQVWTFRSIISIKEFFLELKVSGAFASGLGLNSFESCFPYFQVESTLKT